MTGLVGSGYLAFMGKAGRAWTFHAKKQIVQRTAHIIGPDGFRFAFCGQNGRLIEQAFQFCT